MHLDKERSKIKRRKGKKEAILQESTGFTRNHCLRSINWPMERKDISKRNLVPDHTKRIKFRIEITTNDFHYFIF